MGDEDQRDNAAGATTGAAMKVSAWSVRGSRLFPDRRTLVMGILNVTPDSFSDAGAFSRPDAAVAQGKALVEAGADIIDIGGESTRPGREETVGPAEECRRVLPVLERLLEECPTALISVDTYHLDTARRSLENGAHIINDIYALRRSPGLAADIAASGAGVILMHMQGEPHNMQVAPHYGDVVVEVKEFLRERIETLVNAGVPEDQIAIDPGFGFGKTLEHNLQLLAGLEYLRLLQRPICIGVSRKGFLGKLTGDLPVTEREEATVAACCAAVFNGASIVRVHNARAARRAMAIIDAVRAYQ